MVFFLASDDASYVNGAELFVDGGMVQIQPAPFGLLLAGLLSEPAGQKLADKLKGFPGGFEPSYTPKKSVDHALPDVDLSVHACRHCAFHKAHGIIQQDFLIADMDANGSHAVQVGVERRGEGIARVMACEI